MTSGAGRREHGIASTASAIEIGVNIVDLGLVYRIEVGGARVRIAMTMTSPAYPLADYLKDLVTSAIRDPRSGRRHRRRVGAPVESGHDVREVRRQLGEGER